MAKKTKKPPRRAAAKRKPKAKAVKPTRTKRPVSRKKIVRRKKAKKPESTFEKFENALMVGAAEIDDIALGMGLLAASRPPPKSRKKSR